MSETCTICGGTDQPGHFYDAVGDNGMRLAHFYVCIPCAAKLGPKQGVSAAYQAEMQRLAGG
jgi:hypothetical protein